MTPITRAEMREAIEYSIIDLGMFLVHTCGYRPGLSLLAALVDKPHDQLEVLEELTGNLAGSYWGEGGDRDLSRMTLCTRSIGQYIIDQRSPLPIEFIFEQVYAFVFEQRVDQCGLVFRDWLHNLRIRIDQASQFLKGGSIQWHPDPNRHYADQRSSLEPLRDLVATADARLRLHEGGYLTVKELATATGLGEQTVRNLASRKDYALTFKKIGTTSYLDREASRPWLDARAEFQPPEVIDSFPIYLAMAWQLIETDCQEHGASLREVLGTTTLEAILDTLPERGLEPLITLMDIMEQRGLWDRLPDGDRLRWSAETYLLHHYIN